MALSGGLNTYGYVNANLLKLIDPRGLDSCSPFLNLGFFEIQKCTRTPPANPLPIRPQLLFHFLKVSLLNSEKVMSCQDVNRYVLIVQHSAQIGIQLIFMIYKV